MSKSPKLAILCRFPMTYLRVEPSLLGKSHRFVINGFAISISLPKKNEVKRFTGYAPGEDYRLTYHEVKEIDGKDEPITYWVGQIDLKIAIANQKKAKEAEELAPKAIDVWLRTLRWRATNSRIGRLNSESISKKSQTLLIDEQTGKRVGSLNLQLVMQKTPLTTESVWKQTQKALRSTQTPPVQFDLFFDSVEHYYVGDYKRVVNDCAIACEISLRSLMVERLSKKVGEKTLRHLNRANMETIRNDLLPELLLPFEKSKYEMLKQELSELFKNRNDLFHKGRIEGLSEAKCKEYLNATWEIMSLMKSHVHSPLYMLDSGLALEIGGSEVSYNG